jgi:hypothetical protein
MTVFIGGELTQTAMAVGGALLFTQVRQTDAV